MNGEMPDTPTRKSAIRSNRTTMGTIHHALFSRAKAQSSRSRRPRFLRARMGNQQTDWPPKTQKTRKWTGEQKPVERGTLSNGSGGIIFVFFVANGLVQSGAKVRGAGAVRRLAGWFFFSRKKGP